MFEEDEAGGKAQHGWLFSDISATAQFVSWQNLAAKLTKRSVTREN